MPLLKMSAPTHLRGKAVRKALPAMSAKGPAPDPPVDDPRTEIESATRYVRGLKDKPNYTEHRGLCVPPEDRGEVGDIYFDEEKKNIYVKEDGKWVVVVVEKLDGTSKGCAHPNLPCGLWFNPLTGDFIGWFTGKSRSSIRNKAVSAGKQEILDLQEAIEKALAKPLPDERQQMDAKRHREFRASNPRPQKRAKTNASDGGPSESTLTAVSDNHQVNSSNPSASNSASQEVVVGSGVFALSLELSECSIFAY